MDQEIIVYVQFVGIWEIGMRVLDVQKTFENMN